MDWKKFLTPYFSQERPDVADMMINKIVTILPPNPTIDQQTIILNFLPNLIKPLLEEMENIKNKTVSEVLSTGIEREKLDAFLLGQDIEMDKTLIQNLSNSTFSQGILRFKILLYNNDKTELTHEISQCSWRYFRKTNAKCVTLFPNIDHIKMTQDQIDIYRERFLHLYKQMVQVFERLLDIQKGMVVVFTRDITVIKRVLHTFVTYKYEDISDKYLQMWEQDKECQIGSIILIECE